MLPEISLAKGACTLWEEELLLDYTIEVEDEHYRVHKVIMASVSDYFKAMLTGGMVESREDRVRLEGLSSLAVHNIIEFIYTGQFGSLRASLEELLACAVYLQIPSAINACTTSLCEEVDKINCFRILSIFKAYAMKDGIEHTVEFIKLNFEAILKDCDSEELTYDEFLNLMGHWERSEWELFTMAIQWLNVDYEKRKKHVNEIMSHVRFCLMSPTEVASIKDLDLFLDHDGPWHELVEKALRYHNLPTHQKVLDESEQSRVRSEPSPVCFRVLPSFRGELFAMDKDKCWVYHKAVNPPPLNLHRNCDSFLTYGEANNFLIVSDPDGEQETKWYIYDPRNMTWSTMTSPEIPRDSFAMCYHDKHLYALGGEDRREEHGYDATDIIEKYDFQTNSWSIISSKMPSLRTDHSAFSIGNCIYITDGYESYEGSWCPDKRLHCLDTHTGQWSEKDVTSRKVHYVQAVEIDGEKVLAGMDEDMALQYYKPSTDQWLVYNLSAPRKLKWGKCGSQLVGGNTIFFLNFVPDKEADEESSNQSTDDDQVLTVCEKWTFGGKELKIEPLDDYPIVSEESDDPYYDPIDNMCVLLSHPIQE